MYVVAYMSCGYAIGYVVGPVLWDYARRHGLVGITDMVAHRYGRPWLGAAVAVLATVFLLPYIQLQITGMGVVVSTVTYGTVSLEWAYFIAFAVTTGFVVVSGLRGSAWVSVLKDVLVIATLAFLAVYVPLHWFGGYGELFDRLAAERPQWLTLPGAGSGEGGRGELGVAWFASTSVLNALTVVIFPTTVAGYLGARNADALRRNAILLPAYNVLLFVPMLLGMAALFVVPGLAGADSNLALFKLVVDSLAGVGGGGDRGGGGAVVDRADGGVHAGHRDDVGAQRALARAALELGRAAETRLAAGGRRGRDDRAGDDVHRAEHPGEALAHLLRGHGATGTDAAVGAGVAQVHADCRGERAGGGRRGRLRAGLHGQRPGVGRECGHGRARCEPGGGAGGDLVRSAGSGGSAAGRGGARP